MRRALAWITLAAALAGCGVSKELYLQKEAELAACKGSLASGETALAACRQDAEARQRDLEALNAEEAKAKQDLGALRAEKGGADKRALAELEECRRQGAQNLAECKEAAARAEAEAEAALKEVEAMKTREAELRARLEKEILDQTVEIERLRAKLSVRVVDHILFDSGSAEILKDGKLVLDKVAETIGGTSERVRVEGHSDGVPVSKRLKGKYFSNWELSAARAANVVRYFQHGKGVDPARMEAVGLAQYRPDAPNDTFEGRAQNRRVVIVLTPPKEEPAPRAAGN